MPLAQSICPSVMLDSRRAAIVLGLVAWIVIGMFTRTSTDSAHEWSRLGTVESLVERHNYFLEESKFRNTRDKIFRDGHYYSHQPPLLATLVAPVYWVIHQTGLRLTTSAPVDYAYFLFVWFTNGVAFALLVIALQRTLLLLDVPPARATLAALLLPFGTWLFPYAVMSNNHGISAMLVTAMAFALIAIERGGSTPARARLLGGSLGLMAAFEVLPLVSFVPATAVFLWVKRRQMAARDGRHLALWFAMPLVAHAVLNIPITGDVIPAGFHTELFNFEGTTFTAAELTGSIKHASLGAFGSYVMRALVSGKGLFTLSPILIIGLAAGVLMHGRWRGLQASRFVLLAGALLSLAAALLTTNNLGGAAVGFRHATYVVPVFLVLTSPLLAGRTRLAAAASSVILVLAAATAVMLWWYAVRNPWLDLHLPLPALASTP